MNKKSSHHPDYTVKRLQVESLFKAGKRQKEIIELTGVSKGVVNCQIYRLRKREKTEDNIFDVQKFQNWIV